MAMTEDYLFTFRCLLCRQQYDANANFKNINSTNVHSSKKSIKDVLLHLTKCIKTEVLLEDNSYVCGSCYEKLIEYDQIMLQLLMYQRKLSNMLETSINTLDDFVKKEEDESDLSMQGVSDDDDHDSNEEPWHNTKQEFSTNSSFTSYQCSICQRKLSSKSSLSAHLEAHAKAKKCNICGVFRRDEEYLELHMNVHEGKSENECRYCPKRYSRRSNVIRHMHLHWDKKKFQCEKCGLRFSQGNLLYNHKMHHEAEETPLVCNKCGQTFKSKKTFSHHMITHLEDRPMYPCDMCGKKFTEKYTLKIHSKTHKGLNKEDSEAIKRLHSTQIKKEKQTQEYPCIICDAVYGGREILEVHMAEEHDVIGQIKVFI